jgi:ABC-type polysaccharide/polyol phosphate transport system ATPase subunit
MSGNAIDLSLVDVWKAYRRNAGRSADTFWALQEISFDVPCGAALGVIGRNGAGKSTLLKLLAGITAPTRGRIVIHGTVAALIEVGSGFHPELTGRENVFLSGAILGMGRREIAAKLESIVEFAGVGQFIDTPVKWYSSGMYVRLGFAVAAHLEADILLVDEVLAVGDAAFQRKCFEEFERLRGERRTILFVTHDMSSVQRFCDRAMLIEKGRLLDIGAPADIARRYNEVNFGQVPADSSPVAGMLGEEARIGSAWIENDRGETVPASFYGDTCTACMEVEFLHEVPNAVFGVVFRNEVRHTTFVPTSGNIPIPGPFARGDRLLVRLTFENWLAMSRYTLTPTVGTLDPEYRVLDQRQDVAALVVDSPLRTGGAVDIPTSFEMERR